MRRESLKVGRPKSKVVITFTVDISIQRQIFEVSADTKFCGRGRVLNELVTYGERG